MPMLPFNWSTDDTAKSDELSVMSSRWGIQALAGSSVTNTTSSTFEDLGGIRFMIRSSYQSLYSNYLVTFGASIYATVNGTDCEIGLEINGTTTSVAFLRIDNANVEKTIMGMAFVAPPYTPGFYVASLKWRRAAGSGTVGMLAYYQMSCVVREV